MERRALLERIGVVAATGVLVGCLDDGTTGDDGGPAAVGDGDQSDNDESDADGDGADGADNDSSPDGGGSDDGTTGDDDSDGADGDDSDDGSAPDDTASDDVESRSLQATGDADRLEDVESFPDEGRSHVAAGTDIEYERVPPLSGPHYSSAASAGFYEETPPLGELVHTLEHGAVIVYYDPAAITDEAEASLQQFASEHAGIWQSFLAVPNPKDDPEAAYVLTAWRHRLYVDDYDAETVYHFLSEYLGRGPENQVR